MKAAIFIEQNGVLASVPVVNNQQVQPLTLEQFAVNPSVIVPLRRLKAAGFSLIATSNQPGLSRGQLSRRELDRMHVLMRQTFGLDDILVCPHDVTDVCPCRKPKPGLFTEACFKWHLDLDRSFVLSDKWQDAEAARIVGSTSVLLQSPWIGRTHRDIVVPDISAAVEKILQRQAVHQRVALAI
jgi:D-glycero-D-manno-heptose 1,7-bisphosphate phosphatase